MGKLSTHILDTVHGGPAANVLIELYSMDTTQPKLLVTLVLSSGRHQRLTTLISWPR